MKKQRILVLGSNNAMGQRVASMLAASEWAEAAVLKSQIPAHDSKLESIDVNPEGSSLAALLPTFDGIVVAIDGKPKAIRSQTAAVFANGMPPITTRIVHVSSMTVYGDISNPLGGEVDEQFPFGETRSPYALARVESEMLARAHPNVVTLRPGCEYGPHCVAWSTRVAQWLSARRVGDLGANGDGVCSLVYIDDVASAVLSALRADGVAGQAFNLSMPQPPTWNEYFMQFAKSLRAVPVKRISKRRLQIETTLLAPPLKIAELITGLIGTRPAFIPPAIPPSAAEQFLRGVHLNSSKATRSLNISWTPLTQGLNSTAQWLQT